NAGRWTDTLPPRYEDRLFSSPRPRTDPPALTETCTSQLCLVRHPTGIPALPPEAGTNTLEPNSARCAGSATDGEALRRVPWRLRAWTAKYFGSLGTSIGVSNPLRAAVTPSV